MREYVIGIRKDVGVRHHPWSTGEHDENHIYYNFKNRPELIRSSLEDFLSFKQYQSVQEFFNLIEWLNSPQSQFETNDCALKAAIEPNDQRELSDKDFVIAGRVMVFLRKIQWNVSPDSRQAFVRPSTPNPQQPDFVVSQELGWLMERSREIISELFPDDENTCIGLELMPTLFEDAEGAHEDKLGYEIAYKFWAWGNDEPEVFENFGLIVETLFTTFRTLNLELETKKRVNPTDVL